MCIATARALKAAGPWGQGFPEPVFDGAFTVADVRVVGGRHLKLRLREAGAKDDDCAAPRSFDAIAFGYADGAPSAALQLARGDLVELAYRLEINEYNGAESVQLNCQHLGAR
jgi:single-stranded-DNA-specific exonuclease